jgi:hypothetical protein
MHTYFITDASACTNAVDKQENSRKQIRLCVVCARSKLIGRNQQLLCVHASRTAGSTISHLHIATIPFLYSARVFVVANTHTRWIGPISHTQSTVCAHIIEQPWMDVHKINQCTLYKLCALAHTRAATPPGVVKR